MNQRPGAVFLRACAIAALAIATDHHVRASLAEPPERAQAEATAMVPGNDVDCAMLEMAYLDCVLSGGGNKCVPPPPECRSGTPANPLTGFADSAAVVRFAEEAAAWNPGASRDAVTEGIVRWLSPLL